MFGDSQQTKEAKSWGVRLAHALLAGMQHGLPLDRKIWYILVELLMHSYLDPDIPLLGISPRVLLK